MKLAAVLALVSGTVLVPAAEPANAAPPVTTRAAPDPAADPGKYVGKTQDHYRLTFRVTLGGRTLRGFDTAVVVYCAGSSTTDGPQVQSVVLPAFDLSVSGKFKEKFKDRVDGVVVKAKVRGDIDRGWLETGTLAYSLTGDGFECKTDGPQPLTAVRTA